MTEAAVLLEISAMRDAHLAVWDKVIAEKNKEWLVAYAVCGNRYCMGQGHEDCPDMQGTGAQKLHGLYRGKVLLSREESASNFWSSAK